MGGKVSLKKDLHIFHEYVNIATICEKLRLGCLVLVCVCQREREGGIRLRAMPGFLPGAAA